MSEGAAPRRAAPFLAAALLLPTGTALAGGTGDPGDMQVSWWRLIAALVLCLGLAVSVAYALKLGSGRAIVAHNGALWPPDLSRTLKLLTPQSRRMVLVETLRLSHQVDVCLIHLGDLEFAVAAGPHGGTLLFKRPKPAAPASDPSAAEPVS